MTSDVDQKALRQEMQQLRTRLATVSSTLSVLQTNQAMMVERARQAEEMLGLLQSDYSADPQAVAALIVSHLDQRGDTLAHHLTALVNTTAVSLATALETSDADLRVLVNTVVAGLGRALASLEQVKIADNKRSKTR